MTITVKRVTKRTLDSYFEVFSNTLITQFPEYSKKKIEFFISMPWSKRRYKKLLRNKNRLLLGAWVNNKLASVLDAEMPFGGVSLCIWVMVDSKFQRKGVGIKLLTTWENIVKKKGSHSLYLYADKRNISYYKKLGFELLGLWSRSWFGGDVYIFTKLIQEPREENYLK